MINPHYLIYINDNFYYLLNQKIQNEIKFIYIYIYTGRNQ